MKTIKINSAYKITQGALMDWNGRAVGYDSESGIVSLKLDEVTTVDIKADCVEQY